MEPKIKKVKEKGKDKTSAFKIYNPTVEELDHLQGTYKYKTDNDKLVEDPLYKNFGGKILNNR